MTRRILAITTLVGAAFALIVPAAWGSDPIRDNGDATDAKLAARQSPPVIVRDHGDATQAKLEARPSPQIIVRDHGDATQAKLLFQSQTVGIVRDHGDATQAKLALRSSSSVVVRDRRDRSATPTPLQPQLVEVVRDHGDAAAARRVSEPTPMVVRDHGDAAAAKLALQSQPETQPVASTSGRDPDWSQLGLWLGVGMFLVFGVMLAIRLARSRPLAH